ncbi:MAG: RCC1 domain-containing protein [Verrucomicrobiia bacterium]
MEKRTSPVVCLALAALLWSSSTVRAGIPQGISQDVPQLEENPSAQPESELLLTNTTDLVGLYLEGYNFPIGSWVWAPGTFFPVFFQPMTIVWADTASLPSGLAGITNSVPTSLESVNAWPLWVTLWPQSNTVTVLQPWSDATLTEFSVPDGFPSWQVYEANLYPSCILFGINYTNCETLVEQGYTQFSPPQVITHAWLMDVGSRDTYWNNLEAQCAAAQTASAASMSSSFMPMDDDDGGGGDPCSLTNLLQAFAVTNIVRNASGSTTITWQSCQFFRYLVFSASSLSTNTQWVPQAYVWGATNASATSWTDTATTNADGSTVTQRFYRVQRILGSPVAAGGESSVVLRPDGSLWVWGTSDGELGDGLVFNFSFMRADGSFVETYLPYPSDVANAASCGVQTITNAVVVAAGGDDYTVVVDATGTVWTFGENGAGQLGNGSAIDPQASPFPISGPPGFTNVVSVAAGFQHTLALCANGTVWAWGNDAFGNGELTNANGALGLGNLLLNLGLSKTNTPFQSQIPPGTVIVAIAAGDAFSLAVDTNGLVWGWGDNEYGEIGAGAPSGVGTLDGTNVPTLVQGVTNVIAIAAGANSSTSDGSIKGGGHSIALTADKRVWTWGDNELGELGNGTTGGYDPTPTVVTNLTNVVAIAGGVGFTLAVTSNGQVYAWGDNSFGELGTNTSAVASANLPMLVAGIGNAVWVSAPRSDDGICDVNGPQTPICVHYPYPSSPNKYVGGMHAMAVTLDPVDGSGQMTNRCWGWGDNTFGQVGTGLNGGAGGATNQVSQYSPAGPLQFCTRCQREVQLGTMGTFQAQCNGTLYLYFNTDNFTGYNAVGGGGSYTTTILGSNSAVICSNVTVLATNSQGIAVGTVTIGNVYTFNASGYCVYDYNHDQADANGKDSVSSNLVGCSFSFLNVTNSVCPSDRCFSLVGKIQ